MQRKTILGGWAVCAAATGLWAQDTARPVVAVPALQMDHLINVGPPGPGTPGLTVQIITKDGEFAGQPVAGAPFSAHEVNETVQTLADGNRITRTTESQFYRDSQGRVRHEMSFMPPPGAAGVPKHTMISIDDPVAGVSYSLEPEQHIARKLIRPTPQDGAELRAKLTAENRASGEGATNVFYYRTTKDNGNPPATEDLGTQTIEGVAATGTRTTTTIPAGEMGNEQPIRIVSERWYSPDLHAVVLSKLNDPRIGETTHKLTNINRSEPDPSLFQVPAGYTVQDSKPRVMLRTNPQ